MTFDEWFEYFNPTIENMTFREFIKHYADAAWKAGQQEMMKQIIKDMNDD